MQKHTKIYMKHFNYGTDDFIPSEVSGRWATDLHHLTFRSHGGKDTIDNLMALTREEHERAHNEPEYNEQLKQIHLKYIS